MDFQRSVLNLECPRGKISHGWKTNCPNEAGEGFLQRLRLVVDEDGLFMSGPAVVEILHEYRPIRRRFDSSLTMVGGLLPQPEMAKDTLYLARFMDQAYDLHFMGASGTTERVNIPDPFDEFSPGFRRPPPWPMVGRMQAFRNSPPD